MIFTFSNVVSIIALLVSVATFFRVWWRDREEGKIKFARRLSEFISESEVCIENAKDLDRMSVEVLEDVEARINELPDGFKKRKSIDDFDMLKIITLNSRVENIRLVGLIHDIREYRYKPSALQLEYQFGELYKTKAQLEDVKKQLNKLQNISD